MAHRAPYLKSLDDDADASLVIIALQSAPYESHKSLRVVCKRFNTIIASPAFRNWRVDKGLAEYVLVTKRDCAKARRVGTSSLGRWPTITPFQNDAPFFEGVCSAIVEDGDGPPEMWVMGGDFFDWNPEIPQIKRRVEAYNVRTNKWRLCQSLCEARCDAVSGVVGGRRLLRAVPKMQLTATTRLEFKVPLKSVETYTPKGWHRLPDLPHAAEQATACVDKNKFYVMGGLGDPDAFGVSEASNKMQILELSGDKFAWTVKKDLPVALHSAASAVVDGKVWLIGGSNWHNQSTDVFIYDPEGDTWSNGPPLPILRNLAYHVNIAKMLDGELHIIVTNYELVEMPRERQRRIFRHRAGVGTGIVPKSRWCCV